MGLSNDAELAGEHPGVFRMMLWQNVMIVSWARTADAVGFRELGANITRALQRSGRDKFSFIHVVPHQMHLPDAAARAELQHISKVLWHHTACTALLGGGGGFWASAVRGLITGLQVLMPKSFELRMLNDTPELVAWFPQEHENATGVKIDPQGLAAQLEQAQRWQQMSSPPTAASE